MPDVPITKTEAFEVITIDQLSRPDPKGGVKDTYRVSFLTKGGTRLTRELEEEQMEESKFIKYLTSEAQKFDKLKAL